MITEQQKQMIAVGCVLASLNWWSRIPNDYSVGRRYGCERCGKWLKWGEYHNCVPSTSAKESEEE